MKPIAEENGAPVLNIDDAGGVLVMTLSRPHARNAFNLALADALSEALDRLDEDPQLLVGIVTGAGKTFSSGADLKALLRGERAHTEKRGGFGIMKRPPDKPLIAAIEGHAVAGGFELALCADLIVAAEDARFGLPEVKRGLVAVGGGLFRLPKRIPYHTAMEIALTGDLYSAARMHQLGIVNQVVPSGGALDAARALALRLMENGPLALGATKRIVANSLEWTEARAWTEQRAIAKRALESEDAKEGPRAFAEKRKPVWKAR